MQELSKKDIGNLVSSVMSKKDEQKGFTDSKQRLGTQTSKKSVFEEEKNQMLLSIDRKLDEATSVKMVESQQIQRTKQDQNQDEQQDDTVPQKYYLRNLKPTTKKVPYAFNKLSEKEKEYEFLNLYDTNQQLKSHQTELESKIQKLQTQLYIIDVENKNTKDQLIHKKNASNLDKHDAREFNQLQSQNQQLKEKIKILSDTRQQFAKKPEIKAKPQKQLITAQDLKLKDKRIKELLRVNDLLKKQLIAAEKQLQEAQSDKYSNQQLSQSVLKNFSMYDLDKVGGRNKDTLITQFRMKLDELQRQNTHQVKENQMKQDRILELKQQNDSVQLRNHELEGEFNKNNFYKKNYEEASKKIEELKKQNTNLESKIKDLVSFPFIQDNEDITTIKSQLRQTQDENNELKTTLSETSTKNTEYATELKLNDKQLKELDARIKTQQEEIFKLREFQYQSQKIYNPIMELVKDDQDKFLETLGQLKWNSEEPAWNRLDMIDRPANAKYNDTGVLLQEIQNLKLEKASFASELHKAQILLQQQKEILQDKEQFYEKGVKHYQDEINQLQKKIKDLEQMVNLKGYRKDLDNQNLVEGKNDVWYDDSISQFSVESTLFEELKDEYNMLDLWLGNGELDENTIALMISKQLPNASGFDIKNLLTFITVDFYNHDTKHSSIVQGLVNNYNFQLAFKVQTDDVFINHLEDSYIKIEMYATINQDAVRLGTGILELKTLIEANSQENISGVVTSLISIKDEGESDLLFGIINYKMRMRYPIFQSIQRQQQWKQQGMLQQLQEQQLSEEAVLSQKKKIIIQIGEATGFSEKSKTFIYYQFLGKDYYTTTQPGSTPFYNYTGQHLIIYDDIFITHLKKNDLEFVIFDDAVPLGMQLPTQDEQYLDYIGTAKISLTKLLQAKKIDQRISIIHPDSDRKLGYLTIKIYWYDQIDQIGQTYHPLQKDVTQDIWLKDITNKIALGIKSKNLNLFSAFLILDIDNDNIISFEDFEKSMLNTLNLRINTTELQEFYNRMPQPFNQHNFESIFRPHLKVEQVNYALEYRNPPMQQIQPGQQQPLQEINQMLNQHSIQLNTSIKERLFELFQKRFNSKTEQQLFSNLNSFNRNNTLEMDKLVEIILQVDSTNFTENELQQYLQQYTELKNPNLINLVQFVQHLYSSQIVSQIPQQQLAGKPYQEKNQFAIIGDDPDIDQFFRALFNYMKQTRCSFIKLFRYFDKDQSKSVSKQELTNFAQTFLKLKFTKTIQDKVFYYINKNTQTEIKLQKFIETLKLVGKSLNDNELFSIKVAAEQNFFDRVIKEVLVSTWNGSKYNTSKLFMEVDTDSSGFITTQELFTYIEKKFQKKFSRDDQDTFFLYFDSNLDNKISISEFCDVFKDFEKFIQKDAGMMEKHQETIQYQKELYNQIIVNIPERILNIFSQQRTVLQSWFTTLAFPTQPNLITRSYFKSALDNLCQQHKIPNLEPILMSKIFNLLSVVHQGQEHVDFNKFINTLNEYRKFQPQQLADTYFTYFAQQAKKKNLNLTEQFNVINTDKDNVISFTEFKDMFKETDIDDEQLRQMMYYISDTQKNFIDKRQFLQFLKKLELKQQLAQK